ncbi:MAG: helix-turn-helix domain-containing protein [Anaerolineae bacterium]|nr:helix-turn-helix domain-containing protein [Anaerolineae bacterium]
MSDEPLASTAERTLRLIELLLAEPEGLAPQELQTRLGISRSTLFLLLATLKKQGYIQQAEKRGRYRSGPRLEALRATAAPSSADLITAFYQETSQRAPAETLSLAMPSPVAVRLLAQVEGSQAVRCVPPLNRPLPELAAAEAVLLEPASAEIQKNGYALHSTADSIHLSLPVCRDGSRPAAALLLSAPAFRWQPVEFLQTFLTDLRSAAARLSYQIGAPAYTPYRRQPAEMLEPTSPLSEAELSSFLQGPWTARLACVRPDGQPHVIPVWQEWDGQAFYVIAWQGSQWAEHVLQNPHVSLTVDEPWLPLRRVTVRGQAESLSPDGSLLPGLLQRMAQRYLGSNAGAPIERVQAVFRIPAETVRGYQGMPGATKSG